ncbi:hypothetical protein [Streptosporangium sp. NPDC006007]|uniref:hypothetical protein n=1 Tax=Streptosporangium sp. NPDC006007 TaxID=3154575 RepID=UPI0033A7BF71
MTGRVPGVPGPGTGGAPCLAVRGHREREGGPAVADSGDERALRALGTALDANAPVVRHGLRRFPEGTPFLWLSSPESGDATVFLDHRQWIYLNEPEPGRPAGQFAAGRVEDDPEVVVERLMSVMVPDRRRSGRLSRALKCGGPGLAAGAGMGFLSAMIMAVLVGGNGYVSDASTAGVYVLATLVGVATALWVGIRRWRRLRRR